MPDIRYQIAVNRTPDNALTSEIAEIEVTQSIDGPATGRVRFAVDICGADMSLLDDPRLNPGQPDTEITVIATPVVQPLGHHTDHQNGPDLCARIDRQFRRWLLDPLQFRSQR